METPLPQHIPDAQPEREGGRAWHPLEGLSQADLRHDFGNELAWKSRWETFRARPDVQARLRTGRVQVERLWSIETGILEGLYTLNQSTTTALLDRGFVPGVIQAQDTNIAPDRLLSILHDHQASVSLVYDYIREERPWSAYTMRELHACIVAHQDTHEAVDSLGRRVQRPLRRGVFKQWPNNPTRPDGRVHHYCPPEQVDSELDRLQFLYKEYSGRRPAVHPVLCAAWLHHCFVQVHPFADGNGRVARALMNWHLLKEDFLPVAITHTRRIPYLRALALADAGDLMPFVAFLLRSLRLMVHQVVQDRVEARSILGPAIPPADEVGDDYLGWGQ